MSRTYVITGARTGVGAASAALLRSAGHQVIGVSRAGSDVEADLSTAEGRLQGAREALRLADGRVDAVIACAATSSPVADVPGVGYFGSVDFLDALRPALASSPAGRAAVVTSMSVLSPNDHRLVDLLRLGDEAAARTRAEELASDSATRALVEPSVKRALARWTRAASVTPAWAGAGIALNAAAPGVTLSERTLPLLETPESTARVDAAVPMPLGYHAPPVAVAQVLVWLTSAENTHTTGQNIFCDGGSDAVLRGEDIWGGDDPGDPV